MIVLFGIGNVLRRDDGAGHALAAHLAPALEQLLTQPTRIIHVHQLAPEHAAEIAHPTTVAVVFCDAALTPDHGPLLQVRRVAPGDEPGAGMTHAVTPAALLAYASLLAPHASWVFPPSFIATVSAADLDHGEGLSASTAAALAGVPDLARALANAIRTTPPAIPSPLP